MEDVIRSSNENIEEIEEKESDPKDTSNYVVEPAFDCKNAQDASENPVNDTTLSPKRNISKNQLKKKRRLEQKMEIKKRRKFQEKEAKAAKAKVEGRDLVEIRRREEERRQSGTGKQRREKKLTQRLELAKESFRVCIDCSFEASMTSKEINSLALQLRYCYASNKNSRNPCLLSATSVTKDSLTFGHLKNVSGFDEWSKRAFTITDQPFDEYYKDDIEKVIYLTSDSENTLRTLENDKVYVIGGIVDRNRLKGAALGRALTIGVQTAKLPIDEHLKKMEATRVLTCNHVFDLLLKFREVDEDWQKALLQILPGRKHAEAKEDNEN